MDIPSEQIIIQIRVGPIDNAIVHHPHVMIPSPLPHSATIKYTTEPLRGINSLRDEGIQIQIKYFLSQLYRWVIILYINSGHQGTATNMQGTETTFECTFLFTFTLESPPAAVPYI